MLLFITGLSVDASCDNTFNEKNNTINSPNYPRKYPYNKHCHWNVDAPIGYQISVERFYHSIEHGYDCAYDSLKIYDGSSKHSERVANLCGYNTYGGITSTSNNLVFVFDSDGAYVADGFQLILTLKGIKIYFVISFDQLVPSSSRKILFLNIFNFRSLDKFHRCNATESFDRK